MIKCLIERTLADISNLPTVGIGDGKSCTKTANVYQTPLGLTLDLPGPDDAELQLDTATVAKLGAFELIKHDIKGVKLLVLESLSDSTIQLRKTVADVVASFGNNVKDGIIVMATKRDRADEDEIIGRLNNIREVMMDLGIGNELVLWQNKRLDDESFNDQLTNLIASISRTKIVATRDLDDLNSQVARKMQALYDTQVPQVKTVMIEVEEQYVQEWEDLERYEDKEIIMKDVEEKYDKMEQYSKREGEWTTGAKVGVGILTAGVSHMVGAGQGYTATKIRTVNATRTVQHPKLVCKTKYRTVVHKDTKTRKVTKPKEVQILVPLEHFRNDALTAVINDARQASRKFS